MNLHQGRAPTRYEDDDEEDDDEFGVFSEDGEARINMIKVRKTKRGQIGSMSSTLGPIEVPNSKTRGHYYSMNGTKTTAEFEGTLTIQHQGMEAIQVTRIRK